jgi:hypothetical protein
MYSKDIDMLDGRKYEILLEVFLSSVRPRIVEDESDGMKPVFCLPSLYFFFSVCLGYLSLKSKPQKVDFVAIKVFFSVTDMKPQNVWSSCMLSIAT